VQEAEEKRGRTGGGNGQLAAVKVAALDFGLLAGGVGNELMQLSPSSLGNALYDPPAVQNVPTASSKVAKAPAACCPRTAAAAYQVV
jgi:hypothetical protein